MHEQQRVWGNVLRLALAGSFAVAFILCGAKPVWLGLRAGAIRSPGEFHSCDSYLEFVTHRPQLAAKLSDAFRALPPGKPIAIVVREEDSASSLLVMLSAYLAWPHTVEILRTEGNPPTINPRDYAAIIYCQLPRERASLPVIRISNNFFLAVSSSP